MIEFEIENKKISLRSSDPKHPITVEKLLPGEKMMPYYDIVLIKSGNYQKRRYDIAVKNEKKMTLISSIWIEKK